MIAFFNTWRGLHKRGFRRHFHLAGGYPALRSAMVAPAVAVSMLTSAAIGYEVCLQQSYYDVRAVEGRIALHQHTIQNLEQVVTNCLNRTGFVMDGRIVLCDAVVTGEPVGDMHGQP